MFLPLAAGTGYRDRSKHEPIDSGGPRANPTDLQALAPARLNWPAPAGRAENHDGTRRWAQFRYPRSPGLGQLNRVRIVAVKTFIGASGAKDRKLWMAQRFEGDLTFPLAIKVIEQHSINRQLLLYVMRHLRH